MKAKRGRPPIAPEERRVTVSVRVLPAVLAKLAARDTNRSRAFERVVMEAA